MFFLLQQRTVWFARVLGANSPRAAGPEPGERFCSCSARERLVGTNCEVIRRFFICYVYAMAHEVERAALAEFLARRGLKQTKQRDAILMAFLSAQGHITSDEIFQAVHKDFPSIGYTTVYRTMKLLVEAGLAQSHHFDDGVVRYEIEHDHHDHLVCVKCGKIIEFECKMIEDVQEQVASRYNFRVLRHRHELYGHCESCGEEA